MILEPRSTFGEHDVVTALKRGERSREMSQTITAIRRSCGLELESPQNLQQSVV